MIYPGQIVKIDVTMGTKIQCRIVEKSHFDKNVWIAETTHATLRFAKGERIVSTEQSISPADEIYKEPDLLDWIVQEEN